MLPKTRAEILIEELVIAIANALSPDSENRTRESANVRRTLSFIAENTREYYI
jgi:hypothetical protein